MYNTHSIVLVTNKPHSPNTKRLLVLEVNCLVKCGSSQEVGGCSSLGGCLMLLRRVLIAGLLLYKYNLKSMHYNAGMKVFCFKLQIDIHCSINIFAACLRVAADPGSNGAMNKMYININVILFIF